MGNSPPVRWGTPGRIRRDNRRRGKVRNRAPMAPHARNGTRIPPCSSGRDARHVVQRTRQPRTSRRAETGGRPHRRRLPRQSAAESSSAAKPPSAGAASPEPLPAKPTTSEPSASSSSVAPSEPSSAESAPASKLLLQARRLPLHRSAASPTWCPARNSPFPSATSPPDVPSTPSLPHPAKPQLGVPASGAGSLLLPRPGGHAGLHRGGLRHRVASGPRRRAPPHRGPALGERMMRTLRTQHRRPVGSAAVEPPSAIFSTSESSFLTALPTAHYTAGSVLANPGRQRGERSPSRRD